MRRALLAFAVLAVLASDGASRADDAGREGKPLAAGPPEAARGPGASSRERSPPQAAAIEFDYRCVRSIGHTDFCRCVRARRPGAVDFDAFILFTSRSRKELGYDRLGDVDRALVDSTVAARDACVELMGWQ